MKIKIGRSSEKPKNDTPNTLGTILDKLGTNRRRDIARFLTINKHNHTTILAQTQPHSNPAVLVEAERQQCNGLLYANITKFR
jgi:hypothetical protein